MPPEHLWRVLVIGSCGAGKSTLARRLGQSLNLPVVHLDALNWMPGWVSMPEAQWRDKVREVVRRDRWVIDGNYAGSLDIRIPAADTVVFLDFPRWQCLWRIFKRIARYHGQTRPDMGLGCPERLDWEFIEYVWNFPEESRPTIIRRLREHASDKRVIVLQTQSQIDRFIGQIEELCR